MTTDYPDIPEGWERVYHNVDFDDMIWSRPDNAWVRIDNLWEASSCAYTVIRRIKHPYDNACGTICIGTER